LGWEIKIKKRAENTFRSRKNILCPLLFLGSQFRQGDFLGVGWADVHQTVNAIKNERGVT
jgi:hypothetical protein